MNFVIGLVLIYGIAMVWGLPNLHPPTTADRRRNRLCRTGSQQGPGRASAPAPARRRLRASRPATSSSRSATPTCTDLRRDGRRGAQGRPVRRRSSCSATRTGRPSSPPSSTSPSTQRWTAEGRRQLRPPSAPSASPPPSSGPTQYNPLSAVPAHVRVHRRPRRRTGQVAGEDPHQDRRAGALHRRRRTRSRDADQRRRRQHHRRRHGRARAVGGVLVLPGPAELRARRDQPGPAAAVRRRPHRDCGVREDPQYDSRRRAAWWPRRR